MSWGWGVLLFVMGSWIGITVMALMAMSGRESERE